MTQTTTMTREKWFEQARKAGQHYWCYAEFIDDNPDGADAAYRAGRDPYEYVKEEGESLDLHEFGPAFGGW
jgi:hypothetical protein